tara:strand:+ start:53 stop:415 length:363 start_codon:yes stop_codon:yes gene_type:complete
MKTLTLLTTILFFGACAIVRSPKSATPTINGVAGEYALKIAEKTYRYIFRRNGVVHYGNNNEQEAKWKVVDNEVHIELADGSSFVSEINQDGSLARIAYIEDGKRTGYSEDKQHTLIKIK